MKYDGATPSASSSFSIIEFRMFLKMRPWLEVAVRRLMLRGHVVGVLLRKVVDALAAREERYALVILDVARLLCDVTAELLADEISALRRPLPPGT